MAQSQGGDKPENTADLKPLYARSIVNSLGSGTRALFFAGSLIGGYLGSFFIGAFGFVLGLQIVYTISAFGRIVDGLTYTTLKEPYRYPSSLKKELWRARWRIPSIWERG